MCKHDYYIVGFASSLFISSSINLECSHCKSFLDIVVLPATDQLFCYSHVNEAAYLSTYYAEYKRFPEIA